MAEQGNTSEYEKLKASKFKQQTMDVWRPELTPTCGLITFAVYTIVFIVFGVILQNSSDSVIFHQEQYDVECDKQLVAKTNGDQCTLKFTISKKIPQPVYFYYQLENFYQNQRDYVKSRDYSQQNGVYKRVDQLGQSCHPIVKVKDLFEWQKKNVADIPVKLADDEPATPCGLVAKSLFNDKFEKIKVVGGADVIMDETKIAWATDKDFKFKNVKSYQKKEGDTITESKNAWKDVQWFDMTDEHFIVWMRYAGLPTFRKLYGRIITDVEAGDYEMTITNRFDVRPFEGKKYIVFSTTNSLGGRSYKLAICFFIAGGFTALYFCFLLFKLIQSKQKTN